MSKNKDCSQFTHRLTTTKLDCGQTLRELTCYKDITLWWFAHFDFINFLLSIPEDERDYNPKGLSFQNQLSKLPLFLFAGLNFCFDLSRKIFLKIVSILYERSEKKGEGEAAAGRILFTAEDIMWRKVKDYETGRIRKSDAFFDSLIKLLREKEDYYLVSTYPLVKYVYPFRSAIQSVKILTEKLKSWDVPHYPFNLYWSVNVWKKEYDASKYFGKMWKILAADRKFRQLCVFNGRDIFDFVSRKIRFYFLVLFPYAVKRIEMSEQMLNKEQPDLILLINEYGIFERSLLIAGKSKGIATLAIQHGNITSSHRGYMYTADEISEAAVVKSPYCPMPDKTAVFGPYFKHLLTNVSAYPENSVIITGQPRYDVLDTLQRRYTKESILKQYGIGADKKIILWTTQCIGLLDEENIKNFRAVRAAMDELDDCVIIIKQHPREGGKYTRMICQYLNLPRNNILIVPKTADTLSLIRACDVMITGWSTTAIEAIAFGKPIIILNLESQPDRTDLVQQGVALGVYRTEDLKPAVERLLKDDTELSRNRKRYVEQYLYKIDGKATQRVAELIKQMVKTQGR